eukprot:1236637-Rhodomonas_salina.1
MHQPAQVRMQRGVGLSAQEFGVQFARARGRVLGFALTDVAEVALGVVQQIRADRDPDRFPPTAH